MNRLFVIPQSPKSLLAKIVNGRIIIEKTIDIPYNSISKVTENNLIISLCHEPNELRVFDKTGKLIIKKNKGFNYKALAIKENIVYLGGIYNGSNSGGELFSIIDLNNPGILIEDIELPIKVVKGKAIDDILILDNKLILVDNLECPKYLLEYDISVPASPYYIQTKELYTSINEHIIKGDINKDWLVLFSSSRTRDYISKDINIIGKTKGSLTISNMVAVEYLDDNLFNFKGTDSDFERIVAEFIKQPKPVQPKDIKQPKPVQPEDDPATYRDICLVDNYLLILRHDGLGYIDLNREIDNSEFKKITTKIPTYGKFIKTENNEVIVVDESNYELV